MRTFLYREIIPIADADVRAGKAVDEGYPSYFVAYEPRPNTPHKVGPLLWRLTSTIIPSWALQMLTAAFQDMSCVLMGTDTHCDCNARTSSDDFAIPCGDPNNPEFRLPDKA